VYNSKVLNEGAVVVKIPAGVIKKLMSKISADIPDALDEKHKEMIKAIQGRKVPDTNDVENAMSKPAMEVAPAVPAVEPAVPVDGIRPEIANMSKADRKAWLENYKATPNSDNPFKKPGGGIGPSPDEVLAAQRKGLPAAELPEDESDAIDSIMKLMKEAKKKK
jgi:hypothetical protein